jgi:ABC-type transport system substrate-binding protein
MLLPASDPLIQLAAPAIQSNMAQCGINLTLQNVDEATLFGQWSKGNFQAVFWGEGGGLNHIFDVDFECLDYRAQVFGTWAKYNDTQVQALLDACKDPTLTDADFTAKSLAVTQYALQNSPFIVTWQWVTTAILSTSVQGLPVPYGRLHVDYGRAYKQGINGFS